MSLKRWIDILIPPNHEKMSPEKLAEYIYDSQKRKGQTFSHSLSTGGFSDEIRSRAIKAHNLCPKNKKNQGIPTKDQFIESFVKLSESK